MIWFHIFLLDQQIPWIQHLFFLKGIYFLTEYDITNRPSLNMYVSTIPSIYVFLFTFSITFFVTFKRTQNHGLQTIRFWQEHCHTELCISLSEYLEMLFFWNECCPQCTAKKGSESQSIYSFRYADVRKNN